MKYQFLTVLFFFFVAPFNLQAQQDEFVNPQNFLEEFSDAVSSRKKDRFMDLFLSDSVSWLVVVSDSDLEGLRKKEPDRQKVNFHPHIDFIDWVVTDQRPKRVEFSNVKLNSNGDIATVYCDYAFYLDGEKTNSGQEAFLLVRTKLGWKASSIAFSSTLAKKQEK